MKQIIALLCMISCIGCKRTSTDTLICGDSVSHWAAISYDKKKRHPAVTNYLILCRKENGWAYYYPIEEPSDTLDENYDVYTGLMRISGKAWPVSVASLICLYSSYKRIEFNVKYITSEELIVVDDKDRCIYFKAAPDGVNDQVSLNYFRYQYPFYLESFGNCISDIE